jgi:hypothetical protein
MGRNYEELQEVIAEFPVALDDRSDELVATLRDSGVLSDEDWTRIVEELRESLRFLAGPNRSASRDAEGHLLIDPDADPRNADWLRSVSASRLAGHHLPAWASLWLWRLGGERGPSFWSKVGAAAGELGCESTSAQKR